MNYKDKIILSDIAKCSVTQKVDFVDLLTETGVAASQSQSSEQLIELFLDNISTNKELLIGAAYLCAFNTSSLSFEGEPAVNNEKVHDIGRRLYSYFEMGEQLPNEEEEHSEIAPIIAGAFQLGKKLFNKARDNRADNEQSRSGTLDYLEKQQAAKTLMIQQVMAQKAAQQAAALQKAEAAAKTKRTYIIAGSIGAGLLLTTAIILYVRSKR